MSGTPIPDVLDHLVDLWTGLNLAGLQVVDGAPYDVTGDFLAVGWDRSDQPSVTWASQHFAAGGQRGRQTLEVSNLLSLSLGDQDLRAVRRQIFTTFDSLDAAVAADRKLGGLALEAWATAGDMTADVEETGDSVEFRFTVQINAVK